MISNKEAYGAIRTEVDAVQPSKDRVFSLQDLERMPTIESAFKEALRLRAQSVTARSIVEDVIFDPKMPGQPKYLLKKGTRLLGHQGVVYHDEDIFPQPDEYRYDRFLPSTDGTPRVFTKNGKVMVDPLKTFGGGRHLCPGRKFITFETKAYLAMLFQKFDMTLEDSMPGLNAKTGGIGIVQPDRDVRVKFSLR